MKKIQIGATITLFKKVNLGSAPDYWRVLDEYDGMYTIAYIRKDGKVNRRRAVRNITIDDIEFLLNENNELEPIRDGQPEPTPEPEPEAAPGRKQKKMPSWAINVPASLVEHVTDDVTLAELLTTAQALILASSDEAEKEELKSYIKKNRRFIRKPVFQW